MFELKKKSLSRWVFEFFWWRKVERTKQLLIVNRILLIKKKENFYKKYKEVLKLVIGRNL